MIENPILILDLGNVIFTIENEGFNAWLNSCKTKNTPANFDSAFRDLYFYYERGDFDCQSFMNQLKDELALTFENEKFKEMWLSIWVKNNPGIEELVKDFKDRLPCYILSNTNAMHMDVYFETKPILSEFRKVFLSYAMKCAKPEKEIYMKVIEELNCKPEQIIFFDDKEENIESAKACGYNGVVFKDAFQTRRDLEALLA